MPRRLLTSAEKIYQNRAAIIDCIKEGARKVIEAEPSVLKVILFGSIVRGDYGLYSDGDVLIVLKESQFQRYFDRIPHFADYFAKVEIPLDIFPYTEREVEKMKVAGNEFVASALKEGLLLAEYDNR